MFIMDILLHSPCGQIVKLLPQWNNLSFFGLITSYTTDHAKCTRRGRNHVPLGPLGFLRMINNCVLFCVVPINTQFQSSWTHSRPLPPWHLIRSRRWAVTIFLDICKHIYHCDKCMIWHYIFSTQPLLNIKSVHNTTWFWFKLAL